MRLLTPEESRTLEDIVDKAGGLTPVIEELEQICFGKEEHILENWQDARSAAQWRKAAEKLERCARTLNL